MQLPPLLPSHSTLETVQTLNNAPVNGASSADTRLNLSAYDPRAVGGRQTVRLSLPSDFAPGLDNIELRVRCDLLPLKTSQYRFVRALSGEWQSILLSFSSRNKEHGQYPLEMELRFHDEQTCLKRWLCSTVLLLPRSDASLSEIHQVFLARQKNVRVIAEDGAIARLQHEGFNAHQYRQFNLEVIARDASVAQVAFPTHQETQRNDTAPGYLAWDEALVEVAPKALTQEQALQQEFRHRTQQESVLTAESVRKDTSPHRAFYHPVRHHWLRILEGQHWCIGRAGFAHEPQLGNGIDIPIAHPRISAMHAVLQHRGTQVEIIDRSRYGILLNGQRLTALQPVKLQVGDQIDLCASFAGQLLWKVIALDHQLVVLQHNSDHGASETLCLVCHTGQTKSQSADAIFRQLAALHANTQAHGFPPFKTETPGTSVNGWKCFAEPYPVLK